MSAYVPRISRATLVHPLFACDVSQIPRAYIPCRLTDFDGDALDPNELSLMSAEDLPFCTVPGSREVLFGCCRFYNPTAYVSQAHTSHLAAARAADEEVNHLAYRGIRISSLPLSQRLKEERPRLDMASPRRRASRRQSARRATRRAGSPASSRVARRHARRRPRAPHVRAGDGSAGGLPALDQLTSFDQF